MGVEVAVWQTEGAFGPVGEWPLAAYSTTITALALVARVFSLQRCRRIGLRWSS